MSEAVDGPTPSDREIEAVAIFGSHGIVDAATTAVAAVVIGSSGEANPVVGSLLDAGVGWAVGSMLLLAGLAAVLWPTAAEAVGTPRWVGLAVAAVGLAVALGNLAAVLLGWWA